MAGRRCQATSHSSFKVKFQYQIYPQIRFFMLTKNLIGFDNFMMKSCIMLILIFSCSDLFSFLYNIYIYIRMLINVPKERPRTCLAPNLANEKFFRNELIFKSLFFCFADLLKTLLHAEAAWRPSARDIVRHPLLSGLMRDESIACLRAHPPSPKVCACVCVCVQRERERERESPEPVLARAAPFAGPCKYVYLPFHTLCLHSRLSVCLSKGRLLRARDAFCEYVQLLPLDYERVSSGGLW